MKVTIIGAGNVGSTCANILANKNILNEIILIDIKKNIAKGKALDIRQSLSITKSNTTIKYSSNNYQKTYNSDIIIITSGITRQPGMSREMLMNANIDIIKSVLKNIIQYSPNSILIIVSNPLDIMTYISYKISKFHHNKVIGMAGVLDVSRYITLIHKKLKIYSIKDIHAIILGNHGDSMLPLIKYTTVSGIPIEQLMSKQEIQKIIYKTKKGGEEIVNLLGTSAWFAPAMAITEMVEIIIKDEKKIIPCCAFLQGQYELNNIFMGVPVILGKNGVEKIIELKLDEEEKKLFHQAARNIHEIIQNIKY
jgi:malate dehydrogenase